MSIKSDLATFCDLERQIKALEVERNEVRHRLLEHARQIADEQGAAPTFRTDLGTVYLVTPKPRVDIFDENMFAASAVEILGAGAVEVVTRVRDEHRSALLSSIQSTPTGIPITPEGEPVGGVSVMPRPSYLGIKLAKPSEESF